MIHSLAGGQLKHNQILNIAKIRIINNTEINQIFWYLNPFKELKIDDTVIVPLGKSNNHTLGIVLKINNNVNEQFFPIPLKNLKEIIKIIKK